MSPARPTPDGITRYLGLIRSESESLLSAVLFLLLFSRSESGVREKMSKFFFLFIRVGFWRIQVVKEKKSGCDTSLYFQSGSRKTPRAFGAEKELLYHVITTAPAHCVTPIESSQIDGISGWTFEVTHSHVKKGTRSKRMQQGILSLSFSSVSLLFFFF